MEGSAGKNESCFLKPVVQPKVSIVRNKTQTEVEKGSTERHEKFGTPGKLQQTLAASAANMTSLGLGMVFGFSAVALPQLQHKSSTIDVDDEEASWIASVSALSLSGGGLLAAIFLDRFGRRTTLCILCIPFAFGWMTIAIAKDVTTLVIGRLVVGLGGGMVDPACQSYISELSLPSLRGQLGATTSLCFVCGVLLVYILGWFLPWRFVSCIGVFVSVISLIALAFVPESPYWLLTKDRYEQAKLSLLWLRGGRKIETEEEFQNMVKFMESRKTNQNSTSLKSKFVKFWSLNSIRQPFMLLTCVFLFQQFCGMNVVVFYAVSLLKHSGNAVNEYLAACTIAACRVVITVMACLLIQHFGRRSLLIASGLGMAISMGTLGTYFHFSSQMDASEIPMGWVPLVFLALFMATNTVGFFTVPWVFLGEMFPAANRGLVTGIMTTIVYFYMFIVIKSFPLLQVTLGRAGTFWIFSGISTIGMIFTLLAVPETKGRSLQDIETMFTSRRSLVPRCTERIADTPLDTAAMKSLI